MRTSSLPRTGLDWPWSSQAFGTSGTSSMPPADFDLRSIISVDEFEALARTSLSNMAFEYLSAGVGDEITVGENRAAFDRLRILPRVLVDVSHIDTSVTLFGRKHASPILL